MRVEYMTLICMTHGVQVIWLQSERGKTCAVISLLLPLMLAIERSTNVDLEGLLVQVRDTL